MMASRIDATAPTDRALLGLGLVCLLLSTHTTWSTTSLFGRAGSITPLGTPEFRLSAMLILALIVIGAVTSAEGPRMSLIVAAVAAEIWGVAALAVWWVGARLPIGFTGDLVEEGTLLAPGVGTIFGMVGAGSFIAGVILTRTKNSPGLNFLPRRIKAIRLALMVACLALLLWVRTVPWVRVGDGRYETELGIDAAFGVGDFFAALTLACAAAVVVVTVWTTGQSVAVGASLGAILAGAASTAWLATTALEWSAHNILERAEATHPLNNAVEDLNGGLYTAVAGIAVMGFCVASLLARNRETRKV